MGGRGGRGGGRGGGGGGGGGFRGGGGGGRGWEGGRGEGGGDYYYQCNTPNIVSNKFCDASVTSSFPGDCK